jgi:aminodeoxychorismate synthase component I
LNSLPNSQNPILKTWSPESVGALFFDSALPQDGSRSLLFHNPIAFLHAPLADGKWIDEELARHAQKYPHGAIAGAITFDGIAWLALYSAPSYLPAGSLPPALLQARAAEFKLELVPSLQPEAYRSLVRRVREYIAAGDIYQACITYPLVGSFSGSPAGAYLALRAASPAPQAAFCNLGDLFLLSASPELFLKIDSRRIRTRPIKGTRPRSVTSKPQADPFARALLDSEKERAELVMITDMERNDLGRVCEFGSVHVPELLRVESYAHLHHLVSTVEGTLRSDVGPAQALAACFPGGSISGAPKIRALQIISELESSPRGFYTGAIGWFGCDGSSQWSIAIRTLVLQGSKASYGTGAGIVADSDPDLEWEETLLKAAAVLSLSKNSFLRCDRHLWQSKEACL